MDPISLLSLLGAGGSLAGAVANGIGAWGAGNAQREAIERAMGMQRGMWQQQQQQQAPYLQAGQSTLADLLRQMQAGAFDVDGASLANDPGYQFRLAEGQKALERSAAARGGLNSGGTLRSLARYSQGVASDELQNAWTRRQGAFSRLAHIAGMGQGAANTLGQFGAQHANNMSSLYGAQGNADASQWIGMSDAAGRAVTGPTAAGMGYAMAQPGMQTGAQQLPQQGGGASTGYASNHRPPNGFGLNYGGR